MDAADIKMLLQTTESHPSNYGRMNYNTPQYQLDSVNLKDRRQTQHVDDSDHQTIEEEKKGLKPSKKEVNFTIAGIKIRKKEIVTHIESAVICLEIYQLTNQK